MLNQDRPILISDNDGIIQAPGFSNERSQSSGSEPTWNQCWSLPQQPGASASYTYRIDDRGHQLPSRDLPSPAYQVIESGDHRQQPASWAPTQKWVTHGICVFDRGVDSAALTLQGKMLHSWSGAEIPLPISRATTGGVIVSEMGKAAKVWQKPNEYIIVDHPNGRDEFYHANNLFVSENKSAAGGYTRDYSFQNAGVEVKQLADGRLHIFRDSMALIVDKNGKIADFDPVSELFSNPASSRRLLPKRPVVSDSHGVNVINFDNGVKLFVKPNGGTVISGNDIRDF